MDNTFGITPEEVADFTPAESPMSDLQASVLVGEDWKARAVAVAALPNLQSNLKLAMILFGEVEILFQMFVLHAVADEELTVPQALTIVANVCDGVVSDPTRISQMLSLFMALGLVSIDMSRSEDRVVTAEVLLSTDALRPGPMHSVTAAMSREPFENTLASMDNLLQEGIEEGLGVTLANVPETSEEEPETSEEEAP